MRALILLTPLLLLPGLAKAEPSLAVRNNSLGNASVADCLERGRAAFTSAGFRLAESSATIQIAVNGDYVASLACTQSQPAAMVINVAGPRNADAERLANQVREAVVNPGATSGQKNR